MVSLETTFPVDLLNGVDAAVAEAKELLEMDMEACHEAGRIGADLLSRGEAMGSADLFIAAISKRHGQRVLTRDRTFAKVRGLTVETY